MKKAWVIMMLVCMTVLSGCNSQQTIETIADDAAVFAPADACEIQLSMPEDVPVMEGTEGEKLYLCDGYTVIVQTLTGGDIEKTFQTVSGYDKDALTVMKTMQDGITCYESAWCVAGEGGDQTCRTMILDDGSYHYAVTAMADYNQAGELRETWENILNSVMLSTG